MRGVIRIDWYGDKVYPQRMYLLVDASKNISRLVSLPDIKNGYEIKPWSFLSKHDFTIKVQEAQITELSSNQDSSAALSLFQKIVEVAGPLAAEALKGAAGKAVADIDLASAFGLQTGIYELDETGRLKRVADYP